MKTFLIKYGSAFILSLTAFLLPIKDFLITVGVAVFLDMLLAIYTTLKKNGWQSFQSKRLKDTVAKSVIYFFAIVLANQIESLYNFELLVKVIVGIILGVELKSIDEKFEVLFNFSLFKWLIKMLPDPNKQKNIHEESK